jgi:CheY-like chemotaxis protein
LTGFDGWLVKPVRARSLFERLAAEFPQRPHEGALKPAPRRSPTRRALLAEDNDVNALIARKALLRLGFDVVRAADGEEAVRLAAPAAFGAPRPFDLILMDLKMPGLDGFEATRRLRRLEAESDSPPTPIVALTANALDDERRSCLAAGFDAFLVKPFDFDDLAREIERLSGACGKDPGALTRAS